MVDIMLLTFLAKFSLKRISRAIDYIALIGIKKKGKANLFLIEKEVHYFGS